MFMKIALIAFAIFFLLLVFDMVTDKLPRWLKDIAMAALFISIVLFAVSAFVWLWTVMP